MASAPTPPGPCVHVLFEKIMQATCPICHNKHKPHNVMWYDETRYDIICSFIQAAKRQKQCFFNTHTHNVWCIISVWKFNPLKASKSGWGAIIDQMATSKEQNLVEHGLGWKSWTWSETDDDEIFIHLKQQEVIEGKMWGWIGGLVYPSSYHPMKLHLCPKSLKSK